MESPTCELSESLTDGVNFFCPITLSGAGLWSFSLADEEASKRQEEAELEEHLMKDSIKVNHLEADLEPAHCHSILSFGAPIDTFDYFTQNHSAHLDSAWGCSISGQQQRERLAGSVN